MKVVNIIPNNFNLNAWKFSYCCYLIDQIVPIPRNGGGGLINFDCSKGGRLNREGGGAC